MQDLQNPDYVDCLTGMFRVVELHGPFATLCCWDLDDQVISGVFLNNQNDPSLCEGSLHLMELVLYRSQWRVTFCGPAYDESEWEFCECGECELCRELAEE